MKNARLLPWSIAMAVGFSSVTPLKTSLTTCVAVAGVPPDSGMVKTPVWVAICDPEVSLKLACVK